MRFLSICSGIEAASVAFGPLGWRAVGFSEIEPFPCAVLAHHYPDVPNLGDMTRFGEWPEMDFDLLCGGTPCQAFSVAGKRNGLDDERGNLTLVFCGIADRYNPEWILWENVPGVLSSKDNAFGCFLGELCGSDAAIEPVCGRWPNAGVVAGPKRTAAWRVLDAQFVRVDGYPYAVPQRRRRVFVVARPGASGDPATVLFEPEGMRRHTPPRRTTGERVAGTIGARTAGGGGLGTDFECDGGLIGCMAHGQGGAEICEDAAPSLTCNHEAPIAFSCKDNGRDCQVDVAPTLRAMNSSEGNSNGGGQMAVAIQERAVSENPESGPDGKGFNTDGVAYTLEARSHVQAVAHTTGDGFWQDGFGALRARNQESHEHLVAFQQNQLGEIRSNDICGTVNTNSNASGRNTPMVYSGQAMQVRRLMPVECERLQGFPDNHTRIPWRGKPAEECPDGPRYKAVGNSWAVNCARWIGMRIELVNNNPEMVLQ